MRQIGTVNNQGSISELYISNDLNGLCYMDYDYDELTYLDGIPVDEIDESVECNIESLEIPEEFESLDIIGFVKLKDENTIVFNHDRWCLVDILTGKVVKSGDIDSSVSFDPEEID